MYAIIATGGKQYKVSEGDIITIEKLGVDAGEKVTFDQVLAGSGDDMKVGNPTVAGATVEASVIKEGRAKKVIVYKYKRKTGYHKCRNTCADNITSCFRISGMTDAVKSHYIFMIL